LSFLQNRYRIELPDDQPQQQSRPVAPGEEGWEANGGANAAGGRTRSSSSSSDDEPKRAFPVIQIDMKGYGY